MRTRILTAKKVERLKPEPGQRFARDVPDGAVPGLGLVVQPSGRKSWSLRYRFAGKQTRLKLGTYPAKTLAQAREEAMKKLRALERGEDPGAEPENEVQAKPPDTVADVAAEWLARAVNGRQRTAAETERILRRYVLPEWENRPVKGVGKADALRLLDGIVDAGKGVQANRVLNVLRRFFNWAVERGVLEGSPVAGIRPPGEERSRERVLTDEELAAVWQAADELGYPFGPFIRLLILTAQRRGELGGMCWEHVDLENALWTQPRTKAGRVHDVPLSGAALDILESLPRFEGAYTFTTTSGRKPLVGWSKFKSRLDRALVAAGAEVKPWTVHDLRRTAATHMAAMNVPPHVLAAILNHSPGRTLGISAVYIRHRYLAERREALESWAGHVLELVDEKGAEVDPFGIKTPSLVVGLVR